MRSKSFRQPLLLAALILVAPFLISSCGEKPVPAGPAAVKIQGTPIADTRYEIQNTQQLAGAASKARVTASGYLDIGFDKLSNFFTSVTYEIVNSNTPFFYYSPRLAGKIPDEIKALDGKDVSIQGFMLPLALEADRVREFMLLKNQRFCCFGKTPNANEWVHVRVKGKGFKVVMDQPVTIYGRFQVGEYAENHHLLNLYRLEGEGISVSGRL